MRARGYVMAGMHPGVLTRLLRRNGVSLRPANLAALAFVGQNAGWAALLAGVEKKLRSSEIDEIPAHTNPLFIVGHWRTGTTFLHQLLARDPDLAVPTLFHCLYPSSFLVSRPYVAPIVKPFVRGTRPMDAVEIGFDQPHEDEDAIFRLTGMSPLENLVFGDSSRFFLADDPTFLPPDEDLPTWKAAVRTFADRLHHHTGRRVAFKNPFHSARLPLLRELFPAARYIYIHRDPRVVIPSTIHMWTQLGSQNTFRKSYRPPSVEEVVEVFDRVTTKLVGDLQQLPEDRWSTVAFADLEADPIATVEAAYDGIGLTLGDDARVGMEAFVASVADYRKNTDELDDDDLRTITEGLAEHIARDGY